MQSHPQSTKTVDPRIPTMPGRNTSSFHRPCRYRVYQARSTVRCSSSRAWRVSCILLRINLWGELPPLVRTAAFLHMNASFERIQLHDGGALGALNLSGSGHSREQLRYPHSRIKRLFSVKSRLGGPRLHFGGPPDGADPRDPKCAGRG